ncbi:GntP family permease [Tissierella creatinophila]|uniref:High-affinity gluconate transporter n=1 Tax=Tissierella creatinophila DSM 6911 TaxID=1123403 RepID=A0A1U7M2G6_TISCR|nr:gluconate:H+ symporter [Tissierella creatinophila]OLS01513.1 high-affinity gluconate transporter [Tissierella creatinophila DSM 6911]
MGDVAISGNQMIIGMIVGIVLLVYLILKTKFHTFLALIIAAIVVGLVGGMPVEDVIAAITSGFGSTLGSIGIIIGFGVMMGEIFEKSGAAKRMAYTFLRLFGKDKEESALAVTGFLVSIPIFCDSGFIILAPLARALSQQTKKSIVTLGIALASGLVITHTMVPPTPGPVGAAGIYGANVGSVILWGIVIAIPMLLAVMPYAKKLGKEIYQIPEEDGDGWIRPDSVQIPKDFESSFNEADLPGTFTSFAPIMVPIILILLNTVGAVLKFGGIFGKVVTFLGTPLVAVAIGLIIAILTLTKGISREETLKTMEKGISSAGIVILVTGGGGALGSVLRTSGVGEYIAGYIAGSKIPLLFLPFLISTLIRFIQGSGTVAMLTSASMTAPIMSSLSVDPVFATLSACIGSLFFSYFSDSFFWVVNRTIGITNPKEQMRIWSIPTTIAWAVGFVSLLIINAFFG